MSTQKNPSVKQNADQLEDRICAAIAEVRLKDKTVEWRAACDECMDAIRKIWQ